MKNVVLRVWQSKVISPVFFPASSCIFSFLFFIFICLFFCGLEVAFAPRCTVLFLLLSNFPNLSVRLLVDTVNPVVKCNFSILAFFPFSLLQLVKAKFSLQDLSWWVMLLAFSRYYSLSTVVIFNTCMWSSQFWKKKGGGEKL